MPNQTQPRKLESLISETNKSIQRNKGASVVCDAIFQILVYRDPKELLMDIMSIDGSTKKALAFEELYQMWIALTGYLVRLPVDESNVEAGKVKKILLFILTRLQLNVNLQRLEVLKKENPNVSEKELAQRVISEEGGLFGEIKDETPQE